MLGAGSARRWTIGVAAFTLPLALLLAYIWLTRSVASIYKVWSYAAWVMDLGALGLTIAIGAALAWVATTGRARGALLGTYAVAVFAALSPMCFADSACWSMGNAPEANALV